MDLQSRLFIQPFVKLNALEDYIIVDQQNFISQDRIQYRAYFKENNQLVEITKEKILINAINIQRLKAYIIGLETKTLKLFEFLIEYDMLNSNYLNIFKMHPIQKDITHSNFSDKMTLKYFTLQEYLQILQNEQQTSHTLTQQDKTNLKFEILQQIIQQIEHFHFLTKTPVLSLCTQNIQIIEKSSYEQVRNQTITSFNGEKIRAMPNIQVQIKDMEIDISKVIADQNSKVEILRCLPPEYLFNASEFYNLIEADYWCLGSLIYEIFIDQPLLQIEKAEDKLDKLIDVIGLPINELNVPYCNPNLFNQIFSKSHSSRAKFTSPEIEYSHCFMLSETGNFNLKDLIKGLLQWNPFYRLRLADVRNRFNEIHSQISEDFDILQSRERNLNTYQSNCQKMKFTNDLSSTLNRLHNQTQYQIASQFSNQNPLNLSSKHQSVRFQEKIDLNENINSSQLLVDTDLDFSLTQKLSTNRYCYSSDVPLINQTSSCKDSVMNTVEKLYDKQKENISSYQRVKQSVQDYQSRYSSLQKQSKESTFNSLMNSQRLGVSHNHISNTKNYPISPQLIEMKLESEIKMKQTDIEIGSQVISHRSNISSKSEKEKSYLTNLKQIEHQTQPLDLKQLKRISDKFGSNSQNQIQDQSQDYSFQFSQSQRISNIYQQPKQLQHSNSEINDTFQECQNALNLHQNNENIKTHQNTTKQSLQNTVIKTDKQNTIMKQFSTQQFTRNQEHQILRDSLEFGYKNNQNSFPRLQNQLECSIDEDKENVNSQQQSHHLSRNLSTVIKPYIKEDYSTQNQQNLYSDSLENVKRKFEYDDNQHKSSQNSYKQSAINNIDKNCSIYDSLEFPKTANQSDILSHEKIYIEQNENDSRDISYY
eukprot:403351728